MTSGGGRKIAVNKFHFRVCEREVGNLRGWNDLNFIDSSFGIPYAISKLFD